MAKVLIVYGTTGGNTEIVCEKVAEVLTKSKHKAELLKAEFADEKNLKNYDYFILASPTYQIGELQEQMHKFFYELDTEKLKGRKFAVIGLGDSKYEINYMFESASILENAISKAGGKIIQEALKINKQPIPYLENRVTSWAEELAKKL